VLLVVVAVVVVVVDDEVAESFLQASISIGPAAAAVTNAFKKSFRSILSPFNDIKVRKHGKKLMSLPLNYKYVSIKVFKQLKDIRIIP
jgi:hypothetical protein